MKTAPTFPLSHLLTCGILLALLTFVTLAPAADGVRLKDKRQLTPTQARTAWHSNMVAVEVLLDGTNSTALVSSSNLFYAALGAGTGISYEFTPTNVIITSSGGTTTNAQPPSGTLTNLSGTGAITNAASPLTVASSVVSLPLGLANMMTNVIHVTTADNLKTVFAGITNNSVVQFGAGTFTVYPSNFAINTVGASYMLVTNKTNVVIRGHEQGTRLLGSGSGQFLNFSDCENIVVDNLLFESDKGKVAGYTSNGVPVVTSALLFSSTNRFVRLNALKFKNLAVHGISTLMDAGNLQENFALTEIYGEGLGCTNVASVGSSDGSVFAYSGNNLSMIGFRSIGSIRGFECFNSVGGNTASNMLFSHGVIQDIGKSGIHIVGSGPIRNVTISDVHIIGGTDTAPEEVGGYGVHIDGNSRNINLNNVTVSGVPLQGFFITDGPTNIFLNNCRAYNIGEIGFAVVDPAGGGNTISTIQFNNCVSENTGYEGFQLSGGIDLVVQNSTVKNPGNSREGIYVYGGFDVVTNVIVRNNFIKTTSGTPTSGIRVSNGSKVVTLENNTILGFSTPYLIDVSDSGKTTVTLPLRVVEATLTAGTYTATDTDTDILVPNGTTRTVTLPPTPMRGRTIVVRDGGNFATATNITINQGASDLINGQTSTNIVINGGSLVLRADGTNWQVIAAAIGGGGSVATDAIWDVAGDLVYGTGANTASRLGVGTAGQFLQVNAGATAPQWSSFSSDITVATGGAATITANAVALGTDTTGNYALGDGEAGNASTVVVVDSTDATSFVGIFDSATGGLAAKTDGALLYDASNGNLTSATVDTGQGANELYDMDQNVLTTSSPTFAGMTLGGSLHSKTGLNPSNSIAWWSAGTNLGSVTIGSGLTLTAGTLSASAGSGDVFGPASVTDKQIAVFGGTSGDRLTNSPVTLDPVTGNIANVGNLHVTNIIHALSLTLTNQITYQVEHFSGTNGPVILTNNLDMSLRTFALVTNSVGTNLYYNVSNVVQGNSKIMFLRGLSGTTNRVTFAPLASGTNISWLDSSTNGSFDIEVWGGYQYQVSLICIYATNISASWTTDAPLPVRANSIKVIAGGSVSNAQVGGLVYKEILIPARTNLNATIATFTNALSWITPAHMLTNNYDTLITTWSGRLLSGTNNLKLIYGTQTVLDTGTFTNGATGWRATMEITRSGASAAHAEAQVIFTESTAAAALANGGVFTTEVEITPAHGGSILTNLLQIASNRAGAVSNNFMKVVFEPAIR